MGISNMIMKCFQFGTGLGPNLKSHRSGSVLQWITAKVSTLPEKDVFKHLENGSNGSVEMANFKIEFFAIHIR